ncbi:transcriptional repressor [Leptospira jelokensis]|uniref:Ferric uptake regulation protein n=2 Tax=Leptospira jelokensis TaxID=2484931 RepID=A0A4Z1AB83_9LEPT|nr:transcriptional repressor [Leptospira jelokensis]
MQNDPISQEDTKKEMLAFEEYLKENGLKITNQRLLVAQKIFSSHNHFTAEGLLDELKDNKDRISKATIYRILAIMVEAGLLEEHDFGKDYKYYEHIIGHEHHDHIICMQCGRIVEFIDERIEELQNKAARENGFTITGHSLNIFGNCSNFANCEHKNKK